MSKMIFVNLPVSDLRRRWPSTNLSVREQSRLHRRHGGVHGVERSDQRHAAHARQVAHIHHPPIPPATSSEVMLALSCDNREAVDAMNKAAAENGGTADVNPARISALCTTATWPIPTATSGKRSG